MKIYEIINGILQHGTMNQAWIDRNIRLKYIAADLKNVSYGKFKYFALIQGEG